MQGLITAGLTQRNGNGGGRHMQRGGQHGTCRPVGPAVLRRLVDADTQTGPMRRYRTPLYARPAGFWLNLHGDADPVRQQAPEHSQSRYCIDPVISAMPIFASNMRAACSNNNRTSGLRSMLPKLGKM